MTTGSRRHKRSKHRKKSWSKRKLREDEEEGEPMSKGFGEIVTAGVERWETFYRKCGLKMNKGDEEWMDLINHLRAPLPISFRVRKDTSRPPRSIFDDVTLERNGRWIPGAKEFKWCHGYQLGCDPKTAKEAYPELNEWLKTNHGGIEGIARRQEVASMVPVAVLGIEPAHEVLDTSAAPGSKTLQALDVIDGGRGVVVANELSTRRAYILSGRVGESEGFMVINHKAQLIPKNHTFDRIICDVPCSGDGTFRKYPVKWKHWDPSLGRRLHHTQIQIALRAFSLLKVGGRMSYSTCSVNPLENEAVVQAVLKAVSPHGKLLPAKLSGFRTYPGLNEWQVVEEKEDSPEAFHCEVISYDDSRKEWYRPSMWPSGAFDLSPCMRVYPHLNNTGGFFTAVIEKTGEPWGDVPKEGCTHAHDERLREVGKDGACTLLQMGTISRRVTERPSFKVRKSLSKLARSKLYNVVRAGKKVS